MYRLPSFTEFSWGPWVVYLVLQRFFIGFYGRLPSFTEFS